MMNDNKADIGLTGLAVMGKNLILNMADHGFSVACHNRTTSKTDDFVAGPAKGRDVIGCHTMEDFVAALKSPRRIMLMVTAGKPVDAVIEALTPLLDKGDILIDGGNSHFMDTTRRCRELDEKGILFIGTGVSGGEEGARHGPSIMPGGHPDAWPHVKPLLQAIAAQVDGDPCCEWIGSDGAGHFVKMVHNGIEYGDMQLICEAYQLMRDGLGMAAEEMAAVFAEWNEGELDSYLVQITSEILRRKDPKTGQPMVDIILDVAKQKGTGKWTAQVGLDLGIGVPQIAAAVFARCLAAVKAERVTASGELPGPDASPSIDRDTFLKQLRDAVYASKICSYAQGFQLLSAASKEYDWNLNFGTIAAIWRGGCIIRARFLHDIKKAFDRQDGLTNLLLDAYFKDALTDAQASWRAVVKAGVDLGVPMPGMGTALSYYDTYRTQRLPANLLQAQRDYFGAHTYERVDAPRGKVFHNDWTGEDGETAK